MLDRRNGQHRGGESRARRGAVAVEPLENRLLLARYAVIGDMATTSLSALQAVTAMVEGWNPVHIVTTGDNNNDDDTNFEATIGEYFHEWMHPYLGSKGPGSTTGNRLWPTMGNHDWDSPNGALDYTNYFTLPGTERYYNIRLEDVEFFMTDSDTREPDGTTPTSVQGQWLQAALAASTAPWKIVITHHPPYSSGGSSDATWMRWPFETWGADLVLSGHHHLYERLSVGGFPYVINSAAGASLGGFGTIDPNSVVRYDSQAGATQIDADPASLTLRFFNRSGTQIDSLTLTQPGLPNAPSQLIAAPYSSGRIDLSWTDNTTDETNFILQRSPNGVDNWTSIATPAANVTSYSDTSASLLPGATYHYRVRTAVADLQSADSNVASAATLQPGYFGWVGRGAMWKYLDTGVNQGTAWRNPGFVDTTWASGRSEFGYGDGDEITTVSFGPNAAAKFPTTYFRKTFDVADPSRVIQLDLRLLRDDGAVVYLNGAEVWRSNMPTGAITFSTLASAPQGGAEETRWHGLSIGPGLLVAGNNNVLAVEIHQESATSNDISFDFMLTARIAAAIAPPSAFRATAVASNRVDLRWIDTAVGESGFKIERSTNGINFNQIGTAAAGATTYIDNTTSGGTQYWYRARSYNGAGDSLSSSVATVTTPVGAPSAPAQPASGRPPKNKLSEGNLKWASATDELRLKKDPLDVLV